MDSDYMRLIQSVSEYYYIEEHRVQEAREILNENLAGWKRGSVPRALFLEASICVLIKSICPISRSRWHEENYEGIQQSPELLREWATSPQDLKVEIAYYGELIYLTPDHIEELMALPVQSKPLPRILLPT